MNPQRVLASGLFFAIVGVTGCAAPGSSVEVNAAASGSPYFSLSRPVVYRGGDGLVLYGRVCRRARTTVLSPPRVRLEHVATTGDVVEVAHAFVPAIYGRADLACASYSARVGWSFADGESLRSCFDRGGPCPKDAAATPVRAVPAKP